MSKILKFYNQIFIIMNESIDELFLQKIIETQNKIYHTSHKAGAKDNFVSTEYHSYLSNLEDTKKMLKTYYLQQFSIIQKFSKNDDDSMPEVGTIKSFFSNLFFRKDRNETESDIYKFEFKMIKCQTISKLEEDIFSIDMVHALTSIEKNQDFLTLITFSVIPSYFNFFLRRDDVMNFVAFLKQVYETSDDEIYFQTYSSIIYYTPLFLNFCHNIIFKNVIIDCIHNPQKISYYSNKKTFFNTIIESVMENQHFCPPLLNIFFEEFSKIENFSLSNHIKEHFFLQLFKYPIHFSVIHEFDFLPENIFTEIKKNSTNTVNKNNVDNENDNTNTEGNSSNKDENIDEEISNKNDKNSQDTIDDNDIDDIKCFIEKINQIEINDKLLFSEDNESCEKIFSSFDVEIVKNPSEIRKIDFNDYSYYYYRKKEVEETATIPSKKFFKQKQSFIIIKSLIVPHLLHIDYSLSFINSKIYEDKTISSYSNNELKQIVKNPQIVVDDFNNYYQTADIANAEKFAFYYKKLKNIRFSDFFEAHEKVLDQYDILFSSLVICNQQIIISDILSREKDKFLSRFIKLNSNLLDPFIEQIKRIFDNNGSCFEKQRDLLQLISKFKLFLGERGTGSLLLSIFQYMFIKSNPSRYLSNFAFLENFYFKILPDEENNSQIREIFYSTFNYVFPMKRKKFFSSIVPFISKKISAIFYSSENTFALQSERLIFASEKSFKTYQIIIDYTNSYPSTKNCDLLIMKGDKALSAKSEKVPIKIAICESNNNTKNLNEKYNIHIVDQPLTLRKEVKKCVLNHYE